MRLAHVLAPVSVILGGCVVQPVTTTYHESGCETDLRRASLVTMQMDGLILVNDHCSGTGGCFGTLATSLVITAAVFPISAVISGSIAAIENTGYWLDEQGKCPKHA